MHLSQMLVILLSIFFCSFSSTDTYLYTAVSLDKDKIITLEERVTALEQNKNTQSDKERALFDASNSVLSFANLIIIATSIVVAVLAVLATLVVPLIQDKEHKKRFDKYEADLKKQADDFLKLTNRYTALKKNFDKLEYKQVFKPSAQSSILNQEADTQRSTNPMTETHSFWNFRDVMDSEENVSKKIELLAKHFHYYSNGKQKYFDKWIPEIVIKLPEKIDDQNDKTWVRSLCKNVIKMESIKRETAICIWEMHAKISPFEDDDKALRIYAHCALDLASDVEDTAKELYDSFPASLSIVTGSALLIYYAKINESEKFDEVYALVKKKGLQAPNLESDELDWESRKSIIESIREAMK